MGVASAGGASKRVLWRMYLLSRDPFMSGLDNCMLARNLSTFPTRLRSIYLSLGKLLGQVRRVLYFC